MFSRNLFARLAGILVFFLLVTLLGACSLPSDEPCSEEELVHVEDMAPHITVVDSLTPVLTWSYPDPSCRPGLYHISIFDEDILGEPGDPPAPIHEGQSDGPFYNVPASAGLRPGTTYSWWVSARTAEDRGMGGSSGSWFSTGPLCADLAPPAAPVPVYPPDGAQVYFPSTIRLKWDSPMSCWPPGHFYVQISTHADFSGPSGDDDSTGMVFGDWARATEFIWIPNTPDRFDDCTRYYWRVRAEPAGGGWGPSSEIWSFVPRRTEAICPLELDITRVPPDRPTPWVTIIDDAACWSGPSMEYVILDYLVPGQELELAGRDQSSTWWYVNDPALQRACWVYGERAEAGGDLSQVPIQQAPPVPTRTPTTPPVNCGQYTNPNSCGNNSACWWDPNDPPNSNGSCKRK